MGELDPLIRQYFGKDESPETSWLYLHPTDRNWIKRVVLAGSVDPGYLPTTEHLRLGGDDQRRRMRQIENWYKAWPFARTNQVKVIERHLAALPAARPSMDQELLDVPVITGRPGTGKTFLLKREAVKALCRAAWDLRLDVEDREGPKRLTNVLYDWRPVIYHSTDGNPRAQVFFTHLCHEIGVPAGSDPQAAFSKAVVRHGVQTVFIDEMQMINFDGQHGMYLHNAIKAIQNMNVRVVLSGHNIRQLLTRRQTAAQNATQTQSIARWAFLDLVRYPHATAQDISEWKALLRALESRLRLAGHRPGETVFSETFEQLLWVSTLGYMNALASLITEACLIATRTKKQVITAAIIESIILNQRTEKGRKQRIKSWQAGLFDWGTDASES